MGWFTPKCPVDSEAKDWIENAFNWLVEELGPDVLRDVDVVLPRAAPGLGYEQFATRKHGERKWTVQSSDRDHPERARTRSHDRRTVAHTIRRHTGFALRGSPRAPKKRARWPCGGRLALRAEHRAAREHSRGEGSGRLCRLFFGARRPSAPPALSIRRAAFIG